MAASHKYTARARPGNLPLLVMGVSGVLVLDAAPAVPTTRHHVSAWGKWARDVVVPDVAPQMLLELGRHFEIAWASEWGHNAHTALARTLGLPQEPWPFLPVQINKIDAIRNYAAGSPWAWIDDDVTDLSGAPQASDGVIIRTDPARGIAGIDIGGLVDAVNRLPNPA